MSAYAWPCLRLTSARPRVLPLDLLPFPMVLSLSCCNSSTSPVQSSTAFLHGRGIFHAICQRARSFRTDRTSVGVTTCTTRVRVRHYFRWVKDDKGRRNLGSTISRLHGRRIFHRASYNNIKENLRRAAEYVIGSSRTESRLHPPESFKRATWPTGSASNYKNESRDKLSVCVDTFKKFLELFLRGVVCGKVLHVGT